MTDMMIQTPQGEMEMRLQEQEAVFVKAPEKNQA